MNKTAFIKIWNRTDWKLLIFLLLFLNVKLLVKAIAIVLIYCLRPNFKFGFSFKNSRLPLFYLMVIAIALLSWLLNGLPGGTNYVIVLTTGIIFWLLCILAIQQVKLSVEKNSEATIHNTILMFFIINTAVSFIVYAGIIIETKHLNPYQYQGNFQKYFMGTGDYIKGITMDTSTTNAVLNAFAVMYFITRRNFFPALLCMAALLLTGSNVTNLLLLLSLLYIFIFRANKDQKSIIVVCLAMLVVFFVKVSPQNNSYLSRAWNKVFNDTTIIAYDGGAIPGINLSPAEKQKHEIAIAFLDSISATAIIKPLVAAAAGTVKAPLKPIIPKDSIHTRTFQSKDDTTDAARNLLGFIRQRQAEMPMAAAKKELPRLPGKLIALQQTAEYLKQHPLKILTGAGAGNFSSKLAFRITAMNIAGGFPARFMYMSNDFKRNHFDLYSYYFTNSNDLHSLVHSPNNTYDQLLSEYGVLGLLAFTFFYLGYFLKHIKKMSYGIPLLLFMGGMLFMEYWFEQLSVMIFLELLLLLNIKENTVPKDKEQSNAYN